MSITPKSLADIFFGLSEGMVFTDDRGLSHKLKENGCLLYKDSFGNWHESQATFSNFVWVMKGSIEKGKATLSYEGFDSISSLFLHLEKGGLVYYEDSKSSNVRIKMHGSSFLIACGDGEWTPLRVQFLTDNFQNLKRIH